MNTEGRRIGHTGDAGARLETLYRTIPRWREIIAAVRAGEAEFQHMLAAAGLLELGSSTSSVHPYQDMDMRSSLESYPKIDGTKFRPSRS